MQLIGFSAGAVARGDYRRALRAIRDNRLPAVELSALRVGELADLVAALPELDLRDFRFVSFHAPSKFTPDQEPSVVDLLLKVAAWGFPVVVHPDVIVTEDSWRAFGDLLLIENMDKRKPVGRTADDLARWFEAFPEAGLCFDIGHARQIDPTMIEARLILQRFPVILESLIDQGQSNIRAEVEYARRALEPRVAAVPA